MALHNLKITVVDGGKDEGKGKGWGSGLKKPSGNKGKQDKTQTKLYKLLHYNQTIQASIKESVSPTMFFAIQAGIGLATQTARQAINYYISDIGRQSGDSNYQAMVNRQIEKVTDALSYVGGAFSGAAAGSALGPMGAIIGAVGGVLSAGISQEYKYLERGRAYQHEMFLQNNSQAYNLARANYSALTGRVR